MDRVAAFGAAVWLAMQAPRIGELQLVLLDQLILQPQQAHCDVLICRQDGHGWTPQLWAAFAQFDANAERAYVRDPSSCPAPDAWASGDRLWMLHLIAPQGYSPDLHRRLQALFAGRSARSLSARSHHQGQRVVLWRGQGCSAADARRFWSLRPIQA